MLTSCYDAMGLMAQLPNYFRPVEPKKPGDSRLMVVKPLMHEYKPTVYFVVRIGHRVSRQAQYKYAATWSHRAQTQWQLWYVVERYSYVVASADCHTHEVTEHEAHTDKKAALARLKILIKE
jgi:hypothetical protein